MTNQQHSLADLMHGRVIYVLALVILVQTIYPITANGNSMALIIYQLLYALLLISGFLVARETPFYARLLMALGLIWMVVGIVYTFNQSATWALMAAYCVLIIFQTTVVKVLLQYIFTARRVDRDIIFAASAVYLLIGAIFVPVYGIIETITYTQMNQHAFIDNSIAMTEVFPWQSFIYYSYTTLTTLGYGDILPVTYVARSAASMESIIGVLYVTIIMARLVGLYAVSHSVEH